MDITLLPPVYGFIDLLIMGIGLAASAGGAFMSSSAADEQAEAQANAAAVQNQVNRAVNQRQRNITGLQIEQEKIRKQQLLAESRQQTISAIRTAQFRQATAESTAASQGMGFSSAMEGAEAATQSNLANTLTDIYGSTRRGLDMFRLNRRILRQQQQISNIQTMGSQQTSVYQNQANAAQSDMYTGQAITSFGQQLMGNATTINNVAQAIPGYLNGPMGRSTSTGT